MGLEDQGILRGLSPEEILARKEIQGGIKYDDPFVPDSQPISMTDPRIESRWEESQKIQTPLPIQHQESLSPLESQPLQSPPKNLVQSKGFTPGLEIGWKNLPVSIIPTRGDYYPEGAKIAIRPADTKEIRHFSSIDEEDRLDLNEKLNFILDTCSVISFPGIGVVSYKDLKFEDRVFIIMAIRDLTFAEGENKIILKPETKCENKETCPISNGIELRTGVLSDYELDSRFSKYYSPINRNFCFPIPKLGKEISIWIPSIGVMDEITSFVVEAEFKGIEIDDSFIDIAPFIFPDWRGLTFERILSKMRESDTWAKEEFSFYFEVTRMIKIGTKPEIKIQCPTCGAEVTAPVTFPGGFRSLFVISDIFGELL
jgi:hypothetical protein